MSGDEIRRYEDEQEQRLQDEPGAVIVLNHGLLDDGRGFVEVGLNVLRSGEVWHSLSDRYPRILAAVAAQGYDTTFVEVLTMRSNWDEGRHDEVDAAIRDAWR